MRRTPWDFSVPPVSNIPGRIIKAPEDDDDEESSGKLSHQHIKQIVDWRRAHLSVREILELMNGLGVSITQTAVKYHCDAAGVTVSHEQAQTRVAQKRRESAA